MLGEYLDGDAVAFVRHTEVPNQESLVVVNKSNQRLQQRLLVPHTFFEPKLWFKNLLRWNSTSDSSTRACSSTCPRSRLQSSFLMTVTSCRTTRRGMTTLTSSRASGSGPAVSGYGYRCKSGYRPDCC